MYNLPQKSKGTVLTADNWNNSVEAIQDALNRSSDFQTMLPSVPAASRWTGGRYAADKGGFSLRSLVKTGETWKAYFNPGRVLEIHAGGARVIVPQMGADKMDSVPYPALEAEAGKKVFLDLVWGDNSHDCITEARISTEETPRTFCQADAGRVRVRRSILRVQRGRHHLHPVFDRVYHLRQRLPKRGLARAGRRGCGGQA